MIQLGIEAAMKMTRAIILPAPRSLAFLEKAYGEDDLM
jgi:hypothetical protein